MYNETIIDHFLNPRHVGELADADGVGTIGHSACGGYLRVFIRLEDDMIRDISFLCQGYPAAIASGSATCELALGKTIREAAYIKSSSCRPT